MTQTERKEQIPGDENARCVVTAYPSLVGGTKSERGESQACTIGRIRFSPLWIPLARRKQTAAVVFHGSIVISLVAGFCIAALNPLVWPLVIGYLARLVLSTAATDGELRHRSEWLRSLPLWTHFANYFPMTLHKTHDLPADRKYIMGYHPHGILSHGAWCAFATNALGFPSLFPGITNSLLTLNTNLRIPLVRDWFLAMGLRSVSKQSIHNILSKGGSDGHGRGRAVTIVIGGAREMLIAKPDTCELVLKERKGFAKIALQTGADLVPVIGFGENDLYDRFGSKSFPIVERIQNSLRKLFEIPILLFYGRGLFNYDFGFMPHRREINIVVGKPIRNDSPQRPHPSQEEIQQLHQLYVDEVQRLYDAYSHQFCSNEVPELRILN
ncbi:hypothetical protein HIM_01405 [Hirsutella minnesotensis 3608]|nr:hypothetical protein HIM_01405 [Hirsutella minnesotensis 3608]